MKRIRIKLTKLTAIILSFILCMSLVGQVDSLAAVKYGIVDKDEELINYGIELLELESNAFSIYQSLCTLSADMKADTAGNKVLKVYFDQPILALGTSKVYESSLNAAISSQCKKDVQLAVDAFSRDYPEVFWVDFSKSPISLIVSGKNNSDGSYNWQILGINMTIVSYEALKNSEINAYDNLMDKVDGIVSSASQLSEVEKLKYYHDWICNNVNYDLEADNAHTMYGAFMDGNAVCEGYSKAFKLLCDLSDIPCILISGLSRYEGKDDVNHMWNDCMVSDNWYGADVTNDDQSFIIYDYFLSGSDTEADHFQKTKFSETHIEAGDFSYTGFHTFNYPTLSKSGFYNEILVTETPVPSETLKPSETPVPSETISPTPSGSIIPTETINPSDTPDPGSSERPSSSPDISEEPTPSNLPQLIGDVNGNGFVEASDALIILKFAAKLINLNDYEKVAADIDKSTVIDATDALKVLKVAANILN